MKQKKMMKRVILVALSLLLLLGTLVACGTSTATIDTKYEEQTAKYYFAKLLTQNDEARLKFMAAANGYNMSAEGFDDSKVGTAEDPVDPNAVTYVQYNENGEVVKEYKVSIEGAKKALQMFNITIPADKEGFDLLYAQLDTEEGAQIVVETVVLMQKQTVIAADEGGLFDTIMVWIGKFLGLLTNITGGYYVWALFFFAIVVELVLLYFGIKQQRTSQKQARLRPKEAAIRKKYAGRNDQKSQQALQQELQAMYQQEGVSMFGGCLPLLLQMPIVIALYNIVIDPLHYVMGFGSGVSEAVQRYVTAPQAAGGLGQVITSGRGTIEVLSHDLSNFSSFGWYSNAGEVAMESVSAPNFNLFGLNTGLTPGFQPPYLLLLIPVLTFVAYFFSMKLTRKLSYQPAMMQNQQAGCSGKMMDYMMPLLSVYITFMTPAAVGIYWIFKCIVSTGKQFLLHKLMPMPVFTEEDYKRAERELKGKLRPEERAPIEGRNAGAVRSLHNIDDEDELPARVRERDNGEEEESIHDRRAREAREQKEAEEASRVERARLKSDRKNKRKK